MFRNDNIRRPKHAPLERFLKLSLAGQTEKDRARRERGKHKKERQQDVLEVSAIHLGSFQGGFFFGGFCIKGVVSGVVLLPGCEPTDRGPIYRDIAILSLQCPYLTFSFGNVNSAPKWCDTPLTLSFA